MNNKIAKMSAYSLVFSGFFFVASLFAAAPGKIAYQGKVTDNSGTPWPDANYNFVFSIFSTPSGGTALESLMLTTGTKSGVFSVVLDFNPSHFQNSVTCYLQVTAEGNTFLPRQQLVAAPYALAVAAGSVDTSELKDEAVTTDKIDNNAVDGDKLANMTLPTTVVASSVSVNAVGTTQIADGAVTKSKMLAGDLSAAIYVGQDSRLYTTSTYSTMICSTTALGLAIFSECDGTCPASKPNPATGCTTTKWGFLIKP